ncbi:ROK family protein [bacterium]|nr:ROK family protein [bacterium]
MARYVVGIDMGGDKVRVCVGDDGGGLHGIKSEKVDFSSSHARRIAGKNRSVTAQILRMIEESVESAGRKVSEIECFGIGAAGQPDEKRGQIKHPSNCTFTPLTFPGKIQQRYGKPVRIRNDVAVVVCAARSRGHGLKFPNSRYHAAMTIGTGTNLQIMVDGRMFEDEEGRSLEWGHNVLNMGPYDELPECGCGKRGCIETYISGTGIRNRTIRLLADAYRSAEPERIKDQPIIRQTIARLKKRKKKEEQQEVDTLHPWMLVEKVRAEDVFGLYKQQEKARQEIDPIAKKIVEDTSTYLARAFAHVIQSYPLLPYVEVFGSVAEKDARLTVRAAVRKLKSAPGRYTNREADVHAFTQFLVTKLDNISLRGAVELALH